MRGYWRVPIAAWTVVDADGERPAFPDLVETDRTTYSVYCVSATDPRLDLEAVENATFYGHTIADVEASVRKRFLRTNVRRRVDGEIVQLQVRADDVDADDEVLDQVPAVLWAGDRPEDVLGASRE